MVVVEHAAEALTADNTAARGGVVVRRLDEPIPETLMIAFGVMVLNVLVNDLPQAGTARDPSACLVQSLAQRNPSDGLVAWAHAVRVKRSAAISLRS